MTGSLDTIMASWSNTLDITGNASTTLDLEDSGTTVASGHIAGIGTIILQQSGSSFVFEATGARKSILCATCLGGDTISIGNLTQTIVNMGTIADTVVAATSQNEVSGTGTTAVLTTGGIISLASEDDNLVEKILAHSTLYMNAASSVTADATSGDDMIFVDASEQVVLSGAGSTISAPAALEYMLAGSASQLQDDLLLGALPNIDVMNLPGVVTTTLGIDNQLTISNSITSAVLGLDPSENFGKDYFRLARDAAGNAVISESGIPCFCSGTRILTPTGQRAVETLKIGELVVTVSGIGRAICWIGRRSYGGRFLRGRPDLMPICIAAGALGHGSPQRDLMISPLHSLLIDGALVPAERLVNGRSVCRVAVRAVSYIHIELETHDAIWAEGALAETFLDDNRSRVLFDNMADYAVLYPNAPPPGQRCASLVDNGPRLERLWRQV